MAAKSSTRPKADADAVREGQRRFAPEPRTKGVGLHQITSLSRRLVKLDRNPSEMDKNRIHRSLKGQRNSSATILRLNQGGEIISLLKSVSLA